MTSFKHVEHGKKYNALPSDYLALGPPRVAQNSKTIENQ